MTLEEMIEWEISKIEADIKTVENEMESFKKKEMIIYSDIVALNYSLMVISSMEETISAAKRAIKRYQELLEDGRIEDIEYILENDSPYGGNPDGEPDEIREAILPSLYLQKVFEESGLDPNHPERYPQKKALPGYAALGIPSEEVVFPKVNANNLLVNLSQCISVDLGSSGVSDMLEIIFGMKRRPKWYKQEIEDFYKKFLKLAKQGKLSLL